ncbi:MAG: hypothetical protein IKJ76_10485 [Fibrobacter sp.]|nr:hypothetical protein [Fibrobacter sp.]
MKKQLYVGISLVSASLLMSLVACGDDSSSGTDSKAVTPDFEVQTFDELGICAKTAEGTVGFVKDDQASYTCKSGEWVKNDENSSSKDNDSKDSDDDGGKTQSDDDSGKTSSDDDSGKTSADDDNGDKTPSGDNGDGTPFSFGPAGASLSSEMFESLSGTAWADKDGDLHDKYTFSSLSDGKIPVVATIINDDGTPYDETSFNYSLDVTRGVLVDSFGDDEDYIIYADGLLFKVYLFERFERDGFSEGLVGKWVTEDGDFINISADGKRSINNGVTSTSIEKMSNGVLYCKLGNVQENLYYDGTYLYEVNEVYYPVE